MSQKSPIDPLNPELNQNFTNINWLRLFVTEIFCNLIEAELVVYEKNCDQN
jgi:hypothetical protein